MANSRLQITKKGRGTTKEAELLELKVKPRGLWSS